VRRRNFFILVLTRVDLIGDFNGRENLLAARAGGDVVFPEAELFGCKRTLVIRGEDFRVRTCSVLARAPPGDTRRRCRASASSKRFSLSSGAIFASSI
jgi:hypothetical protein